MNTAVVTGCAGFIGSHLVERLLDLGWNVRGLDNLSTGSFERLRPIVDHDSFSFQKVDIRDLATLEELVEGANVVFHQAAVASVPRSVQRPVETSEVNCTGTANLIEAIRESDVGTLVSASSSAVYGPSEEIPKEESMAVDPTSPYALSKYYTESMTLQAAEYYGIDAVALRYFNIYGPRQDPDGQYAAVVPKFIDLMRNSETPTIFGDGDQTRDFTYVSNVVDANLAAATAGQSGIVCNIGTGTRHSINDLVETLNDILETSIEPVYGDPRPGDVRHSVADITRATEALGYSPTVDFETGLKRTVEYFEQTTDAV